MPMSFASSSIRHLHGVFDGGQFPPVVQRQLVNQTDALDDLNVLFAVLFADNARRDAKTLR